ncbi:Hypothetical protein PBC10988_40090 [Planctomycetales bacterium 10988]|nr:Hypothetical protein PBC10988_40090 [Planctomycetales bacterium 10988]
MQLDRTRIAVRERDYADLLDLSLIVSRGHAWALFRLWFFGVIPVFIFQWVLCFIVLDIDAEWSFYTFEEYMGEDFLLDYGAFWVGTSILLTPLALAPMTIYLGQATFSEDPSVTQAFKSFVPCIFQLFVLQTMFRILLMVACCLPVLFLMMGFPHINEIILLERNSWGGTLTRIQKFHGQNFGLVFLRSIEEGIIFFVFLLPAGWFSLLMVRNLFFNQWEWLDPGLTLGLYFELPILLWVVTGFFTVVRFLGYLDLRIRSEGWEIELQMRAEAQRLEQRFV